MCKKLLELTLAIIKPHVVKQPIAYEELHKKIIQNKFLVVRSKIKNLSRSEAEHFYEEHKNKFFYNRLVTFMSSGPSEFLILTKENAISDWRKLMGPTKVYRAQFSDPDSIRGSFGLSDTRNATHGSDSIDTARREIQLFFPEFNINQWYKYEENYFKNHDVLFSPKEFIHIPTANRNIT